MERIIDGKHYFDSEAYFRGLCEANALAAERGFRFCTCSGIESLEEPLNLMRRERAFFCLDDTNDGSLARGKGGGWYKNRTMTVFLLHRYKDGDLSDRSDKLGLCRELMRQVVSRMLADERRLELDMVMLQPERILSRELGQYFLMGLTGVYFLVDVAEPVDLTYNAEEWISRSPHATESGAS